MLEKYEKTNTIPIRWMYSLYLFLTTIWSQKIKFSNYSFILLCICVMLWNAIKIASDLFTERKDKWWKPYILHCIRVMNNINSEDEDLQSIAILHDVIEDCYDNIDDWLTMLRLNWFNDRVIRWVDLLTHRRWEDYMEYIKKLSYNSDCVQVKIADLKDNSDITRLKWLSKNDIDRLYKYHLAYTYLIS